MGAAEKVLAEPATMQCFSQIGDCRFVDTIEEAGVSASGMRIHNREMGVLMAEPENVTDLMNENGLTQTLW